MNEGKKKNSDVVFEEEYLDRNALSSDEDHNINQELQHSDIDTYREKKKVELNWSWGKWK